MSPDSFDYLPVPGTTPEQMRAACVTLADQALSAAGGDEQAAAEMLRPALEAIGAIPHRPGRRSS
jgi:hypothetical protein